MTVKFLSSALLLIMVHAAIGQPARVPFEFRDGDRVALLGDTLIEREQSTGYLETRLTARYPDRNIYFRNLGWSADTVMGQSRMSFDWNKPEEEWFKKLLSQVAQVDPTVAILGYGMAASFDGEDGLDKFQADLKKLIRAIRDQSKQKEVRFILLSPIRHENLGAPLPDPADHNRQLALYTRAIEQVAREEGARFVNLFELLGDGSQTTPPRPLTDNGIHLNAFGYWRLAEVVEEALGLPPVPWQIRVADGRVLPETARMKIGGIDRNEGSIAFTAQPDLLPFPPLPEDDFQMPIRTPLTLFQFQGLEEGTYVLKVDGKTVRTLPRSAWEAGVTLRYLGPAHERVEELRRVILKKNELYFHRWRPQNETYLFGFRRYEQGQNAREIPMFDPLVSEQESRIGELRRPVSHQFELVKVDPEEALLPQPKMVRGLSRTVEQETDAAERSAQPIPVFEVADGFEVELFAENPQLAKPIQMNFDPQGRLWVASSSVYPQIEPGQTADDKILILEDTDGDGKADKSTVFADGLLIPTGVEPGDGGAYVGQSTELLHFKDRDGDGVADERRVVLSGFGTEDTHHILHTLRWGHDGQLYFNQSIYIHSHVETPHGVVRLNSGGIWHLRPPTMELGVFLKGFINSWGHDFDAFGQSFVTDGAGSDGINYGVPGAMYVTYAGARRILGSVSPGNYPKFCGLEIIASPHFPPEWQGDLITCDFRAHRVVRFSINERGSAYVTEQMPDLLRSTNVTFRPIDVKLGPDGALYVADWSNPIIQHGEVDFRDPRRDHEHGRIWRVKAKGRPLLKKPELIRATNAELLDQLLSPDAFTQRNARRVLTERGRSILPQLKSWTEAQTEEPALLQALWMYQSINETEPDLLKRLLSARDGRIRAAAVRVLSFWHDRVSAPLDLLAAAVEDSHPRVRLEALRALARIPSVRSADLALSVLERPMDSFLDYGLWLTINDLAEPWVEAIRSGEWKIEGREKQIEFGLQAIEPALAGAVLGQLQPIRELSKDGAGPWIELIGRAGSPKELRLLFDRAVRQELEEPALRRALAALAEAGRSRRARPEGDLGTLRSLFEHPSEEVRAGAVRLAGVWRQRGSLTDLLAAAADSAARVVQSAAFQSLREIGGDAAGDGLEALAKEAGDAPTRRQAALALAAVDFARAIPFLVESVNGIEEEGEALAFWRNVLGNKGAAAALSKALEPGGLSVQAARAGMRVAREGGRNEPALVLALARSGNLEEEGLNLTAEEIREMVARMNREGDPHRGELIYRRADLACVTCHAIGGAGGKVGPDMTSIGASSPPDYLIESLLYPNRKVKEGYHSLVVETRDGLEYSGILVSENNEQIVVRDATNREVSIPKADVEKRTIGGSLMPSGLIDSLQPNEQLDLLRFLSELGKPGPYDASKGNVARRWELLPAIIDVAQFGDEKVLAGDLGGRATWVPVFSLVDGRLLKKEMQEPLKAQASRHPSALYASTEFQLAKAGMIELKLSDTAYLGAWIDAQPVSGSSTIRVDLAPGKHRFVIKLDPARLPEHLRLETSDGTFLTN